MYSSQKIVRQTRETIYCADENGNIDKFQRIQAPPTPKPKRKAKKTISKNVPSKPSATEMAATMRECVVPIEFLSAEDIEKIKEKVKRDGQLVAVKNKIKSLPCKIIYEPKMISGQILIIDLF